MLIRNFKDLFEEFNKRIVIKNDEKVNDEIRIKRRGGVCEDEIKRLTNELVEEDREYEFLKKKTERPDLNSSLLERNLRSKNSGRRAPITENKRNNLKLTKQKKSSVSNESIEIEESKVDKTRRQKARNNDQKEDQNNFIENNIGPIGKGLYINNIKLKEYSPRKNNSKEERLATIISPKREYSEGKNISSPKIYRRRLDSVVNNDNVRSARSRTLSGSNSKASIKNYPNMKKNEQLFKEEKNNNFYSN